MPRRRCRHSQANFPCHFDGWIPHKSTWKAIAVAGNVSSHIKPLGKKKTGGSLLQMPGFFGLPPYPTRPKPPGLISIVVVLEICILHACLQGKRCIQDVNYQTWILTLQILDMYGHVGQLTKLIQAMLAAVFEVLIHFPVNLNGRRVQHGTAIKYIPK